MDGSIGNSAAYFFRDFLDRLFDLTNDRMDFFDQVVLDTRQLLDAPRLLVQFLQQRVLVGLGRVCLGQPSRKSQMKSQAPVRPLRCNSPAPK